MSVEINGSGHWEMSIMESLQVERGREGERGEGIKSEREGEGGKGRGGERREIGERIKRERGDKVKFYLHICILLHGSKSGEVDPRGSMSVSVIVSLLFQFSKRSSAQPAQSKKGRTDIYTN